MVLILILGLSAGPGCLAADKVNKIRSVTPPLLQQLPSDVRAEDYFDIVGTLNLIENGRVVIGNSELRIAGGAKTSGLSLYDEVGAQLNRKGEVTEIVVISDIPN